MLVFDFINYLSSESHAVWNLNDDLDSEVTEEQENSILKRHHDHFSSQHSVGEMFKNIVVNSHRVTCYIPGVQSHIPAYINAQAPGKDGDNRKDPADDPVLSFSHQVLNLDQRKKAQHHARPGKGEDQPKIKPKRNILFLLEMQQIGDDVW